MTGRKRQDKVLKKRSAGFFGRGHTKSPKARKQAGVVLVKADEAEDEAPLLAEFEEASASGPNLRSKARSSRKEPAIGNDMRILHVLRLMALIDQVVGGHGRTKCKLPRFTPGQEIKKGVVVSWSLKCRSCGFETERVKLYDEAVTPPGRRGPKPAVQNVALLAVLMNTTIGFAKGRSILNALDIPVPNEKSMKQLSEYVASALKNLAELGETEKLNEATQDKKEVHLLLDTRYNTGRIGSDRRTGLSLTSQGITLGIENNSGSYFIISHHIQSKVCRKGTSLKLKGEHVECPHHEGCTATKDRFESLTEKEAGQAICRKVNNQGVTITHVTTDGDGKCAKGVQEESRTPVKRLADTVHLGMTQMKKAKKVEWSENMFPGAKKKTKRNQCGEALAKDIKRRSTAILKLLHEKHQGSLPDIQREAGNAVRAAICCYQGDCRDCPSNVTACQGNDKEELGNSWCLKSSLLQEHQIVCLNMTNNDVSLMTDIFETVLGYDNLEKTQFLSNTQMNEAANRSLSTVLPKNITFALKQTEARTSCVIDCWNFGPGESALRQRKQLGIPTSDGQGQFFIKEQAKKKYQKAYARDASKKQLRRKREAHLRLGKKKAKAQPQLNEVESDYEKDHLDMDTCLDHHNYHLKVSRI